MDRELLSAKVEDAVDYRQRNIEECGYPYKFSIIMSVYNVEDFIEEAVESVLQQDIGFIENVQIVFVDDGSTDRSGILCDSYKERYPDNIVVIHKPNGGLSSARNIAIKYAEGRYVNYFDPDDRLSKNTLLLVYMFFNKYHDDVEIVSIPLTFFDGMSGPHPLNSKFKKGNRIIDLQRDYQMIQLSSASAFYKLETMQKIMFDETVLTGEDAKENAKLLLKNYSLGVVEGCTYHYRRRSEGQASICQSAASQAAWYIGYLKDFSLSLIKYCKENVDCVPKFVQYTIMYDLQWKLRRKEIPEGLLSEKEKASFFELLARCLEEIDDAIIMEQKSIFREHKLFALKLKYGRQPNIRYRTTDISLGYKETNWGWLSDNYLKIDFIQIKKNCLFISGYAMIPPIEESTDAIVSLKEGDISYTSVPVDRSGMDGYSLGICIFKSIGFSVTIPLADQEEHRLNFVLTLNGHEIYKRVLRFGQFSPVGTKLRESYYCKDSYMLTVHKATLCVKKCGRKGRVMQELKILKELLVSGKRENFKAAAARTLLFGIKPLIRNKIWLVSDKANRADDNGEAFFLYLRKRKQPGIKVYFVIGKSSCDYDKMKQLGNVVNHLSWKHKFLHLLSDKVISAYSHMEIADPFQNYMEPYRDLMRSDMVFLQHGITKDDVSIGLNKYHKNYKVFVTSTQRERQSILQHAYGYTPEEVVLTGMPRFDRLYDDNKKIITIMPTWRRSLFTDMDAVTNIWRLWPGFEQSEYFIFYNKTINDQRLIGAAEKNGYTIQFLPHPTLFPYISYFHPDIRIKVLDENTIYRTVFAESALIVTDYSSVAFDFAYLNKPVVYAHFDREFFRGGGHNYTEGYFSYEDDGFGEVEYDFESTVDRIIEYVKNGCQLKDKYRERINNFFAFHDQNNCQRVFEAICDLEKEESQV